MRAFTLMYRKDDGMSSSDKYLKDWEQLICRKQACNSYCNNVFWRQLANSAAQSKVSNRGIKAADRHTDSDGCKKIRNCEAKCQNTLCFDCLPARINWQPFLRLHLLMQKTVVRGHHCSNAVFL